MNSKIVYKQLLEKLKEINIKPPNQVSYAWNDLSNIIKIIKKK
ncbi:hypothetical protein H6P87_01064 [Rickettsia tillamookensis]|uniref:Uncharacterized protein n=1 Tax=Rickettsia tillamookensis TaxID=2761623 RepID=A0A9E6MIS5_9RICK|nr:hypothetical protein [Rickettsia tillamookensis]QQV75503.1 hypothetical protein H6P87_01064 [Rickettsia tillamookensis]